MSGPATAPAMIGARSSQNRAIQTMDARQAPIPLPRTKPGDRCFRSRSRAFAISVRDEADVIVNGRVIPGIKKIARFQEHSGWFEGKTYTFGELVTADPDVIEVITTHPEFGRLLWDAEAEKDNFLNQRKKDLTLELRSNPDLMAAMRAEMFDLEEPKSDGVAPIEAVKVRKKPGPKPKHIEG